jgi:hypothetical protein
MRVLQVYERFLDPQARRAAEALELLDELEEWRLLMSHYCLCLATAGGELGGGSADEGGGAGGGRSSSAAPLAAHLAAALAPAPLSPFFD